VVDVAVLVVASVRATNTLVVLGREGVKRPIVDGDGVLVGCRVVVALVGEVDESGAISVEGKVFGLWRFCAVSSASRSADDVLIGFFVVTIVSGIQSYFLCLVTSSLHA
jgi:hypothetical protein